MTAAEAHQSGELSAPSDGEKAPFAIIMSQGDRDAFRAALVGVIRPRLAAGLHALMSGQGSVRGWAGDIAEHALALMTGEFRTPWSCTTDGVTEPCGDCDGCRYDRRTT